MKVVRRPSLVPKPLVLDIVLINGLPYVGKDTQAELLVKTDPSAVRISPGEILRDCVHGRNGYRRYFDFEPKKLRRDLKEGRLVDGEILAKGLSHIVTNEIAEGKRRIVFAGWPREAKSFEVFKELMARLRAEDAVVKTHFIYLRASEDEVRRRFEKELHSKKVREREPREDDTPEGFESRLKVFYTETKPFLLERKLDTGLLFVESGPTKHSTQESLLRALTDQGYRTAEGPSTLPAQARK